MADLWTAFLISFGVVFVAELGDKSQLMALAFATRHRPTHVVTGIAMATAAINAISVGVGYGVGLALPSAWVALAGGLLFLGFAIWTLRGADGDGGEDVAALRTRSVVFSVGAAFFLAEFGDKTMIASVALAGQYGWLGTWLGATAGMLLAVGLAIVVGRLLGTRLPEHVIRYGSAGLFAIFGVLMVLAGVTELG